MVNPAAQNIEKENNPTTPEYPLLKAYCQNLMGHEPTTDELLQFFAAKHPNPKNKEDIRYIPRVESMLHALRQVDGGAESFLANLESSGFVASFDGIKIALIDHNVSPRIADAVILGNLEIILQSANDLGLHCIVGMYSGDENIGLFAPKNLTATSEFNKIHEDFNKKLQENAKKFYSNPFFDSAKREIKKLYHNDDFGLTAKYGRTTDVNIYTPLIYKDAVPLKKTQPDIKQAIGSIIDTTDDKGLVRNDDTTTPLLQYLRSSLEFNLNKILEYNLGLERIYPFELQVKKIALLYSDIEKRVSEKEEEVYLVRFADILMKYTNKYHGHTKGDHHMIATANMMRRMLKEIGIDSKDVDIYQHNGSFILTCNQAVYEKIAPNLSDPVTYNKDYAAKEDSRVNRLGQDPALRAHPFVVATTTLLSADGKPEPIKFGPADFANLDNELWVKVNKLQEAQIITETITTLYTSGLALGLLNDLPESIAHILSALNLKLPKQEGTLNLSLNTLNFASLFECYYSLRPNNLVTLLKKLSSHHLLERTDYRMLKNRLKDKIIGSP